MFACDLQEQGEAMQSLLSDACQQHPKPILALVGATIQEGLADTAASMVSPGPMCNLLQRLACQKAVSDLHHAMCKSSDCCMASYFLSAGPPSCLLLSSETVSRPSHQAFIMLNT